MGVIETIFSSWSPRVRRLHRLAAIAGESERLAASLKHHAEMCDFPALKAGIETAALAEAADAKVLRTALLERDVWPALPAAAVGEGANQWARINSDLNAEVELIRALNLAVAEWEGVEPAIAERLRLLAEGKHGTLGILRDLGLRCDPQALD